MMNNNKNDFLPDILVSEHARKQLDIQGFVKKNNMIKTVFQSYLKTYKLKFEEKEYINELIQLLSKTMDRPFRITSVYQNISNKAFHNLFLTVTFENTDYDVVCSEIGKLENLFHSIIENKVKVNIEELNLSELLFYINITTNQNLKKLDIDNLEENELTNVLCANLVQGKELSYTMQDKCVKTYYAKHFPLNESKMYIDKTNISQLVWALDVQRFTADEQRLLNKMIEQRYACELPDNLREVINASFCFAILTEPENSFSIDEKIIDISNKADLLLIKGNHKTPLILNSIYSFGTLKFKPMKNCLLDVVKTILI